MSSFKKRKLVEKNNDTIVDELYKDIEDIKEMMNTMYAKLIKLENILEDLGHGKKDDDVPWYIG